MWAPNAQREQETGETAGRTADYVRRVAIILRQSLSTADYVRRVAIILRQSLSCCAMMHVYVHEGSARGIG